MKTKKNNGFAVLELIIILVVLALLVFVGVQIFKKIGKAVNSRSETPASQNQAKELKWAKGVSLSPKSYGAADFSAFFREAVKSGSVVTWAGNWTDLEKSSGAPYTVSKLGDQYGYQPVIIIGTRHDEAGVSAAQEPLDAANKRRFVAAVSDFAKEYKPPYLGIGNEVNRIYDSQPNDYASLKIWFSEAAEAVREQSPKTKVFIIFQYEQLNGLYGGLFGGKNNESSAKWQLLDDFPAADLIAFTTYPYLIYKDPSLVPADYYSRISNHTTKPIAFTEIGWPSGTEAAGYDSTPEEQASFVSRFAGLTKGLPAKFVIWPFLYDQDIPKPFATLGLIDKSGTPKPALDIWRGVKFE